MATVTAAGFAGCTADRIDDEDDGTDGTPTGPTDDGASTGDGDDGEETLIVATYDSFIDAPSDSPGEWIQEEFERRYDVELQWNAPDQPINHYIERYNQGVDIDAEVYMGIKPNELLRVDENTDGEMFQKIDESRLEHADDVDEQFYFDPRGREVPAYASYASLVYDGREFENPGSFEALLEEEYRGNFGVSNPVEGSNTGLYFLLWSIHEFGEAGESDYDYLDYWNDLLDNDVRIVESWGTLYSQFQNDEVPVIVSYSNDRVYAKRFGNDLDKHQVGFLNRQGYANLNGMVRFTDGTNDDLAYQFMDFILEPETQAKIAELNVTGPVNRKATPPEVYREYAQEPDEVVFFDYEELDGKLSGWLDEWEREVVGSR